MNTDIEYTAPWGPSGSPKIINQNVFYWICDGLDRGGIEKKLDRVINVIAILTEKFLIQNPDELKNFTDILGEEWEEGHRLVEEK